MQLEECNTSAARWQPDCQCWGTIIVPLPTNAIIDMHTLVLSMDAGAYSNISTNPVNVANQPIADFLHYVQSLFRRVDITAGGVQASDYGAAWSLLALNTLGQDKHNKLAKYELGGELPANNNLGSYYSSYQAGLCCTWNYNGSAVAKRNAHSVLRLVQPAQCRPSTCQAVQYNVAPALNYKIAAK